MYQEEIELLGRRQILRRGAGARDDDDGHLPRRGDGLGTRGRGRWWGARGAARLEADLARAELDKECGVQLQPRQWSSRTR